MAAVLAGGCGAVLSHATAAAAWELRPIGAGAIHVTVRGDPGRKRRAGIRIHRSTTLEPHEITSHRAIPITTPARTIIDLAATLKGRPGSPSLQALLSRYTAGSTFTRSELEERFLALCDDHGLPRPETNTRIEGIEVDFVWRDARLIVEVDGYAYHRSPSAFESDRERLQALGAFTSLFEVKAPGARLGGRPWP